MPDVGRVAVGEWKLQCHHCGHTEFRRETLELSHLLLFAGIFSAKAWRDPGTIYVCARCGFVHFFMPLPEVDHRFGDPDEAVEAPLVLDAPPSAAPAAPRGPLTDDSCLSCGARIPANADRCPSCGWTWKDKGEAQAP